jgi:hypothetical protein
MASVELRITINETGQVTVAGPIDNKGLCYSMLECARDAIKEFADARAKQTIVPAGNGAVAALTLNRKG